MAEEAASMEAASEKVVEAVTEAVNGTAKIPATQEGMMIAYGSLVIMALIPIFLGSFRSVDSQREQKDTHERTGERPETMTQKDAMMFPIIASCALFGLYMIFNIFGKEYINLLLSFYFLVLGIFALSHMMSPVVLKLVPAAVPVIPFHLKFTQGEGETKESVIDYQFNTHDLVCLGLCSVVGVWYILKKHWLANDLLGMAFAVNGVELLHLNNVVTGCILLSGLFFYDIFWVFGTDVMVTVAKSFEAPIKLVFPQDLLEKGPMDASNFAMLGLGDIVIPGIFIALLLRYDLSLKRNSNFYFCATFAAYLAGLLLTIFVMHVYKHAQPALLYLVPACLGVPIFLALVRGDIKSMFQYEDHPNLDEKEKKTN
jgi:minor histocompatibility antigen H13